MRAFVTSFFLCYVLLFILTFSFPYHILPDIGASLDDLFEPLAHWSGTRIFGLQDAFTSWLISDSAGFYIHALHLVVFSMLIASILAWYQRRFSRPLPLRRMLITTCRCYLAFQLSIYGFNKLFMLQFFHPEPNTLFTHVGQLSPDILYWTAMGSSPGYNVFMGSAEVITAMLLLSRRAWLAGALLAAGIMINVVAVNFSFDISVKLYSSFLLLNALLLVCSQCAILLYIIQYPNKPAQPFIHPATTKRPIVRALLVILVLAEGVYPAWYNYRHRAEALPSKAYEVVSPASDDAPDNGMQWKRVFLHSRGYFIVQHADDTMHDYRYSWSSDHSEMILRTGDSIAGSVFWKKDHLLQGVIETKEVSVQLSELDFAALPIMTTGFQWTLP